MSSPGEEQEWERHVWRAKLPPDFDPHDPLQMAAMMAREVERLRRSRRLMLAAAVANVVACAISLLLVGLRLLRPLVLGY